jgi:hypothetical protein
VLECHRFVYEYARYGRTVYDGGIGRHDEHGIGCTYVDDNVEQGCCHRSSVWDRTR